MKLTILNVGYPLAPVGPEAVGGAEQILSHLDKALVTDGHKSIVVACEGSTVAGQLVPIPAVQGPFTPAARHNAVCQTQLAIRCALQKWKVDVIHMHGINFHHYLPNCHRPILATLHLPPEWYAPEIFNMDRKDLFLNCVSLHQQKRCRVGITQTVSYIDNGVPYNDLPLPFQKEDYAFCMGRICPEKGYHIALDAARKANVPLLLAGKIFPYPEHQEYFQREICPRLDEQRRFIGPPLLKDKKQLLRRARCLLLPSLANETSSLVAMEALTAGTPVIAFPAGAITEIIEDGKTGFIVHNIQEMAEAIRNVHLLDSERCRQVAIERFSLGRMVEQYFSIYEQLAKQRF